MILWTIRHTKPYNPKDVCYGRLDFDVAESFPEESKGAIDAFVATGAKPSRLFSSPLIRCTKLADLAAAATGLPVEKEDAILEVNFGDWEGEKLTEVGRDQMVNWQKDLRGFKFPNGECFYDVDRRVQKFLDSLDDDGEYLWVTHAGVIASLMHFGCGVPNQQFVEGSFSYEMVTRFDWKRGEDGHFMGSFEKVYDGIQMKPLFGR